MNIVCHPLLHYNLSRIMMTSKIKSQSVRDLTKKKCEIDKGRR